MRLDVFTELINGINKSEDNLHKIYKAGIDLYNIMDDQYKIRSLLLNTYYGEDASEWIDWYCYEKFNSGSPLKAYDEEENEVCDTIESLWELVEDLRLSPNKKEYELPEPMTDEERAKLLWQMFATAR